MSRRHTAMVIGGRDVSYVVPQGERPFYMRASGAIGRKLDSRTMLWVLPSEKGEQVLATETVDDDVTELDESVRALAREISAFQRRAK